MFIEINVGKHCTLSGFMYAFFKMNGEEWSMVPCERIVQMMMISWCCDEWNIVWRNLEYLEYDYLKNVFTLILHFSFYCLSVLDTLTGIWILSFSFRMKKKMIFCLNDIFRGFDMYPSKRYSTCAVVRGTLFRIVVYMVYVVYVLN